MVLADDLITAGVSAVISAAAGLAGAVIGARATRRASVDAFDRTVNREDETWRRALHHECLQNLNLEQEQGSDALWHPDATVLNECSAHASAFSAEVLQRIIWARTALSKFAAKMESAENAINQELNPEFGINALLAGKAKVAEFHREALRDRNRAMGEIREIETALR